MEVNMEIKNTTENNESKDETNNNKTKRKKFTVKQKLALVMLATVDFMSFCSMSIMAPFYPKEATAKGMSESTAGFVFGFYALVVVLSSPVFGKIIPKVGIKLSFIIGVSISGICSIFFGTLHMVENYTLFTVLSFVIRGLEALGASAYATAGYVLIVNIFPDHTGAVIGLLETFVGLGMSAGPAIGGLLFAVGGFGLPFYVIGAIIISLAPLNAYLLPKIDKYKIEKTGSFTGLLKLPQVVVTCLVIIVVASTWGFLDPTLEPHLRKFHLGPGEIALVFLLLSTTYGISSPCWGWLSDKMANYWWLMSIGLFFNCISLMFLGPTPVLPFLESSMTMTIISLSTLGISVAMAQMPTYRGILNSAIAGGFKENLGTHSVIAGLWSCVYSLGEVIGPSVGGALMQQCGFSVTASVFAALNLVIAILCIVYFKTRRVSIVEISKKTINSNDVNSKTAISIIDVPLDIDKKFITLIKD